MPAEFMPDYEVVHAKAKSFFPTYERKEDLQHQTHYCPGCGHGTVSKMLARAIDELGIQDRTILISPVGCSVFGYYYFDTGNIQAAHGRASAVATGVKRSREDAIVISYQGDGDLSAIGSAEILHAANRGENITVIFVNNAVYSMTGGQYAPTTLIGQKTATSPRGRTAINEGYPLHVCELLATLQAPVYIERVGLGDNKQIAKAARSIRRALENQVNGLGFSLIEVLSPCSTIWKLTPVDAQHWVRDVMEKTFPLGVFCDRTKEAVPRIPAEPAPALAALPAILGLEVETPHDPSALLDFSRQHRPVRAAHAQCPNLEGQHESTPKAQVSCPNPDLAIRVAGFGGQGVLLLGEVLAEAGLDAGLEVSWLPSYGPEMRSGTSNCHVRISREPIDSPLVTAPNILVAMNEPSLRKFDTQVPSGGWILYNGDEFPEDCRRNDIHILVLPFTRLADQLGDARAANMVMLGALLEITKALPSASVDAGLRRMVKNPRWVALDERAIRRGRELACTASEK